jgi:hypothetical protein
MPVMMNFCRLLLLLPLAIAPAWATRGPHEEVIYLFQNRKVIIGVPDGLGFSCDKDPRGMILVRIAHPRHQLSMQMAFLPDPNGMFSTSRGRKEFMNETFHKYVANSVERGMQFEELDPRFGSGTYCVFTDASLVGRKTLPAGEYFHSTTGLKVWPGVVVVFTLFSQDTELPEYQAVMTLLRDSIEEVPDLSGP